MSAVPDTSPGRRTIGEILLAHGYVTKEQIDEATAVHLDTGRPLGQILVEAGAITRLELASALAEQWSDSESPLAGQSAGSTLSGAAPTFDIPRPAPPSAQDEELLSRVLQLEAELAAQRASGEDDAAATLQEAVEGLVDRMSVVEPAVEELGRRFELVARDEGPDPRIQELGALFDELTERLALLDQRFDAATARSGQVAEDAANTLDGIREDLRTLFEKMSTLADGDEVGKLREIVDVLSRRPARDAELVTQVETLAEHVAELGDRRDHELVAEVEALGARVRNLAERRDLDLVAQVEMLSALLAELGDRVEAVAAAQATLADGDALAQLQNALGELAQRPVGDPSADRRLDQLAAAFDDLRSSVELLAAKPAGDPQLDEKLWEIASRLEALERADAHDELRGRVEELAERPTADPALAGRVGELEAKVDSLANDDVLAALTADDRSLGFRIDGVVARIDELAAAIDQAADSGIPRDVFEEALAVLNTRIDTAAEAGGRLGELEERLSQLGSAEGVAAPDPQLQEQLNGLTQRVEQLAATVAEASFLVETADGEVASGPTPSPSLERDVEHVLMAIERLSVHLGAHERALTELMGSHGVLAQIQELGARVGDLETYGGGVSADGSGAGAGDGETRAEMRSLMRRLEDAESAQRADRERLMEQLEKAAGAIDWRLQRLESGDDDEPQS